MRKHGLIIQEKMIKCNKLESKKILFGKVMLTTVPCTIPDTYLQITT